MRGKSGEMSIVSLSLSFTQNKNVIKNECAPDVCKIFHFHSDIKVVVQVEVCTLYNRYHISAVYIFYYYINRIFKWLGLSTTTTCVPVKFVLVKLCKTKNSIKKTYSS